MEHPSDLTTVVILESSGCLMAETLDGDTALTVLSLVSEDPSSWVEAQSVWSRYRTPVVCEFVSNLPIEATTGGTAMEALAAAEAWVVIDLESKRVFTGGNFQEVGRDAVFAMVEDEQGNQHCPLSVHLPPWWELHENVEASDVNQPRQSPINKPSVNRDVLFGDVFLNEIARQVLQTFASESWPPTERDDDWRAYHSLTIGVHRDWLLTPRAELGGRTPRELLHGAIDWSGKVTWGQERRFQDNSPLVATPDDWDGFATAPMGSQEMCIYFDLCREVISAGWSWCESEAPARAFRAGSALPESEISALIEVALPELSESLRIVKEEWLNSPFEGGSPPSFIIECDRRRVPRGAGVAIEGISSVQSAEHIADCDCPLCLMLADGVFGVGFTSIDGHHLELDDEFAFSMHETREAWEEQQREYAGFSAAMDKKKAERNLSEVVESEEDDPFASAWSGIQDDNPIPGDRGGFIKLAFMVCEIVSELKHLSADHHEIKTLNEAFADYRRSDQETRPQLALELKSVLQSIDSQHPELISKSADLQSRIDEALREPSPESDFGESRD